MMTFSYFFNKKLLYETKGFYDRSINWKIPLRTKEFKESKEVNICINGIASLNTGNNCIIDDCLKLSYIPVSNKESNSILKIIDNKKNEFIIESKKETKSNTSNPIFINVIQPIRKDYIIKAVKSFMIDILLIYGNKLIKQHKYDDSGKEIEIELLDKIKQNIARNSEVEFNKLLLQYKIKDIFSSSITKKVQRHESDYNKKVIEKYYDSNKVQRIKNFFDMEFQDSFIYLKNKNNSSFEGFEKVYEIQLKNKKEKIQRVIRENSMNFIEIINKRRSK